MRKDGISESMASTIHDGAQATILALNEGNVEEHFTHPRSKVLLLTLEPDETQESVLCSLLNELVVQYGIVKHKGRRHLPMSTGLRISAIK